MTMRSILLPVTLIIIAALSGCAHYTCAPPKHYHDPWVSNGETFSSGEACMTAIWNVGICATDTPAVAEEQIKWALDCTSYCGKEDKKQGIMACTGVSMNQDHGRPLCKRIPANTEMPELENPWYIICSNISATCECTPLKGKKKKTRKWLPY